MEEQSYKELVDEKIREWQQALRKLDEQQDNKQLRARVEQLKPEIDLAATRLAALVEQETLENTMETKEQILTLFTSIDKELYAFHKKTPFML